MHSHEKHQFELLEVPGANNVRELGGYKGQGGQPLAYKRFIRAGGLNSLTTAGVQAVRGLGVDCVIDLRSSRERELYPDTLENDSQVAYVHVPMLDHIQSSFTDENPSAFPDSMEEMYIGLLENDKDCFKKIFETFADPQYKTYIFHCTAGKDRTGLTAMLLLGLAGVSNEDIIEDYSHSQRLLGDMEIPADLPKYLFDSPPQRMADTIAHLDKNYGGIVPYLTAAGVDSKLQEAVIEKLFK